MEKNKGKSDRQFDNVKVLLMEGSSRAALPMSRGFFNLGCNVTTVSGSKLAVGKLTRFAHNKLYFKGVDDDYKKAVTVYNDLIVNGDYDLVVPLSDFSAQIAAEYKERWERGKVKIAVNKKEVFDKIIDKSKTMAICRENNIPAPITIFSNDPIGEIDKGVIDFPVVVKPKTGVGSIGFNIIRNKESLAELLKGYDNSNGPLFVQEYIEQGDAPQFGAELFRDRDGIIRAALVAKVVRWYPIDGGSRLCSISIHDEKILASCKRLLDVIDWNGYANIDLVWDEKEKEAKILEINGRTGASVKLDFLSGVDICRLILENELGLPLSDMLEYEDDKSISCFLVDILWFIHSKKDFLPAPHGLTDGKLKMLFSHGMILCQASDLQ